MQIIHELSSWDGILSRSAPDQPFIVRMDVMRISSGFSDTAFWFLAVLLYRLPIFPCAVDVSTLADTAGTDSNLSPYGISIVIIQYTDNSGPSQTGNVTQSNIGGGHPTG